MYIVCYIFVEAQVSFQLTSMSVAENVFDVDFTLDIVGTFSSTTVSLSIIDGSASKYSANL